MQLGTLSCRNSGRGSPEEEGGIQSLCHRALVARSVFTDIVEKRSRNKFVTSLALNGYGSAFHPPLARSAMTNKE